MADTVMFRVQARDDGASKTLDSVAKKARSIKEEYGKAASGFSSFSGTIRGAVSSVWSAFSSAANAAFNYAKTVGTVVAGATTAAIGLWVKLGAEMEQTNIAFKVLIGNEEEAMSLLSDIQKLAAETPFEFPELAKGAKMLSAYWIEAKNIVPTLTNLGDVASGLGVPLDQLTLAYGQVRAANRLTGAEMRQFINAWVPLGEELAKMLGKTQAEIKDMTEEGKISFAQVEQAFANMTGEGGKFEWMMIRQSKTAAGLRSTLKDNLLVTLKEVIGVSQTGEIIEGGLFEKMKEQLATAIEFLDKNKEQIKVFADGFVKWISTILQVAGAIFSGVKKIVTDNMGSIKHSVQTNMEFARQFRSTYGEDIMKVATKVFGTVKYVVETAMKYIGPLVRNVASMIGEAFRLVAAIIDGDRRKARDAFGGILEFGLKAGVDIANFFFDLIGKAAETLGNYVGEQMDRLVDRIMTAFVNLIKNAFKRWENLTKEIAAWILRGLWRIDDAAKGVAERIAAFLGFASPTEEWPWSQADKRMPNMMAMLASGIIASTPMIAAASNNVAETIEGSMQSVIASTVREDITNKQNTLAENTKKFGEKVGENYGKVADSFEEMRLDFSDSLKKLDDDFEKTSTKIRERAADIAKEFKDLKKEFAIDSGEENMDLASALVEQKDKIVKMREEIDAKKAERDKELQPLLDEFAKTRNKERMDQLEVEMQAIRDKYKDELAEMEKAIQAEGAAYRAATEERKQLSWEIAEVERRNALTEFERFLEDRRIKKEKRIEEFEEKKKLMQDEATELKTAQLAIRTEYETTKQKIITVMTDAYNFYVGKLQAQTKITETETDNMVQYFKNLASAIKDAVSASQDAAEEGLNISSIRFASGGMVSKYGTKKFAGGGVVSGPRWIDRVPAMLSAGEIVLNAAQQRNVASNMQPAGNTYNIYITGNHFVGNKEYAQEIADLIMQDFKLHSKIQGF